jgi:hypothetical protein
MNEVRDSSRYGGAGWAFQTEIYSKPHLLKPPQSDIFSAQINLKEMLLFLQLKNPDSQFISFIIFIRYTADSDNI